MRRLSYRLSYTDLAAEMQGRFFEVLLRSIERLGWDTGRLTVHRRDAMRKTLSFAAERSRWHAERLAGIDLDALDPEDLGALPVMTKRDLMANWDAVVTDPRLVKALHRAGLPAAEVSASVHDELPRTRMGKRIRFVPMH